MRRITEWTLDRFIPMGPFGLFALSFAESSFFPVPPDILLIALALTDPPASFFLAAVTTAGSVTGAVFGYIIGLKGGRPILERFVSKDKIALVHDYFNKYEVWAIGIAGFTPVPYKVFTISAGVFSISFVKFVIVSIFSRGARFFLVGAAIFFYGHKIKSYLREYFNVFSVIFVLLLVAGFAFIRLAAKKRSTGEHKG